MFRLHILPLPVLLFLAGCGAGATAPSPTPTPLSGYTDPASHVNAHIVRMRPAGDHALFLLRLHNGGTHAYSNTAVAPFIDSALIEPNAPGTIHPCDADSTLGPALDYSSVPAGATHLGWLRCDYPPSTHVVAVFWLGHNLGGYHVGG